AVWIADEGMLHLESTADLCHRVKPFCRGLGRQSFRDLEIQPADQEPQQTQHSIQAEQLVQKLHASAFAHRLAAENSGHLDLKQFLAKELVKERQNVNRIILGEEHDSHRSSSVA